MVVIHNKSSLLIKTMTKNLELSECDRKFETIINAIFHGFFNEEYIDDIVYFEVIFFSKDYKNQDDIKVIAWIRDEEVWEYSVNDILHDLKITVLSDEDHEKWQNLHIKDANGHCLTPDEAQNRLHYRSPFYRETDEYYLHLENELNIYNSLLSSGNVTNERYKLSKEEKEKLQIERRRYNYLRYILNKTLL